MRGLEVSESMENRGVHFSPNVVLFNKQELLIRVTIIPADSKGIMLQEGVHFSRR